MRVFRAGLLALLVAVLSGSALSAESRPPTNIVWIIVEDMSANFGCYGEKTIATPNVDRLAREGIRFTNAVVTAPVCSAARSALITGMYQSSIGAHHHRSGRGVEKIRLPDHVRTVPRLFKNAGYLVLNLSIQEFAGPSPNESRAAARTRGQGKNGTRVRIAKTDYNFEWDADDFDHTHWSSRPEGQPFFAQVQLRGGKLRGGGDGKRWPKTVEKTLGSTTPASAVRLPPYLPADPVIVEDWRQYLDAVRFTDHEVGRIVERLRESGELERTYIFFITDHGISHVRNKQFCYDGGVHIPFVVRGPGLEPGTTREDPVEHIDLAATSLGLAGVAIPGWMQARNVLAKNYRPRTFAFSARDRCDETVDRIRSVRSGRYKYIRNFYPKRPYLQPNRYKDNKPILKAMRRLHAAGELNAERARIMAESRPPEELYDLRDDPHEGKNLAASVEHRPQLERMRAALDDWIRATKDRAESPEPAAMYDSDMAKYLKEKRGEQGEILRRNIATMKAWARAGR